jgi:hypothetical protein
MSFWDQIESDFDAVIASADTVVVKLAKLAGIQTRVQEVTTLADQIVAIIDDGTKNTALKTNEILKLVGKL